MNTNQKLVIVVGATVVLGMLFFPPFHVVRAAGTVNAGYSFLFSPPGHATVDIATLALQWVGTIIVTVAAYLVAPPSSEIASVTNASDQNSNAEKKIVQWLVRVIGIIAMVFVSMLILGVGKEAGRLGKQAAQPSPAAVDWSQYTPVAPAQSSATGGNEHLFDVAGARRAGYSDSQIATYLARQSRFDLAGAHKAGYSDSEIIAYFVDGKNPTRNGNYVDQFDAKRAAVPSR